MAEILRQSGNCGSIVIHETKKHVNDFILKNIASYWQMFFVIRDFVIDYESVLNAMKSWYILETTAWSPKGYEILLVSKITSCYFQ